MSPLRLKELKKELFDMGWVYLLVISIALSIFLLKFPMKEMIASGEGTTRAEVAYVYPGPYQSRY